MSQRTSINQLPESADNPGAPISPISMTSGDFDENGVADLIIGFRGSDNFALSLYKGNADSLYPDNPEARRRRSLDRSNISSSLSPAGLFPINDAPDFLVASDFNGDGHLDVATAARGSEGLYLLAGDGHGGFASIKRIELAGRVTALGAREATEAGGSTEIAVGIVNQSGPAVLLFESLDDALGSRPAVIRLADQATTIAFRRSNFSDATDLLVAAGRELLVVPSGITEASAVKTVIRHRTFSSAISSIAVGGFIGDHLSDVALLTAEGAVIVLAETELGELDREGEGFTLGSWPGSTGLIRARISGSNTDDLVLIDSSGNRLHVLIEDETTMSDSSHSPLTQSRVPVSLNVEGEPLAVIPMRLSQNGSTDLVILRAGHIAPASLHTSVAMTFIVNNTSDSGGGSLRDAITLANGNPGADTITFNIPGVAPHTINVLSALPAITESVTINGTSQVDFAGTPVVELSGIIAGAASGLIINAPSCVVRGLVINRFSGNGIVINGNGNFIEGNFIGTSASGTFALGNTQDGVFISGGSSNTVGGTTSAARNVLSGNRNGIQIAGGSGTQVRGNFIGTNAAGTAGLGNSASGVLIGGSSTNAIGAVGSASSNTIAFNGAAGVAVTSGTGNPILSNSIFLNGGLGIDLGPAGVTANDTGDGDTGANNLQNFPVLNSASAVGTSTAIQGTLNSNASTLFRLEFFSNQVPNPSGFGEGQTFIGAINITTDGAGNASFNQTFAVTVAPGQMITATATDPANNTSEFSKSIQVGGLAGGQSADLALLNSIAPNPVVAGSDITKTILVSNIGPATATSVTVTDVLSANASFVSCNSTGGGVCGGSGNNRTITFASLAPGASASITIVASVNCSVPNGSIIGNTATVFSSSTPDPNPLNNVATATVIVTNPAPTITCPGSITQVNDPGKCSATVNFFTPIAVDNCPIFNVACTPPSGSNFAIGTTGVTCIATDAGGATATCSFSVTVTDVERITIVCPSNVSVTAPSGQCSPPVNFVAPSVIDNCPGANFSCVPPSGSSFPLGVSNVICTAVDAKGIQATCGFTVTVNGLPQAVLRLEGNGTVLDFGPVAAGRKPKKLKKQPVRNFTVENIGCLPLVLTLDSISRTGDDVVSGRITDPDDRKLFVLSLVDAAGVETSLDILGDVRILPGAKQNFKVRFNPTIPAVADDTRGLPADAVLPDLVTSVITFTQNGGPPIRVNLVGHVDTALVLTNPDNPRAGPVVLFSRIEDEFIIEFTIFDSNRDVNRAVYQFFDSHQRPAEQPITVNLAPLIQQSRFVRGQSFTIVQKISGAKDHPQIVGVMVTVSDGKSSDSANSNPNAGTASIQIRREK